MSSFVEGDGSEDEGANEKNPGACQLCETGRQLLRIHMLITTSPKMALTTVHVATPLHGTPRVSYPAISGIAAMRQRQNHPSIATTTIGNR
jgi:hypothetical protein